MLTSLKKSISLNLRIAIILSMFFCTQCTFGSIGDRNEEKLIILQNLLELNRNRRTILASEFQFYGDTVDNLPERFVVNSNSFSYTVRLLNDSEVRWDSGAFRINPNSGLIPGLNERNLEESSLNDDSLPSSGTKTHTPFTVPLDLPSSDPYAQNYNFLASGIESLVKSELVNTDFGPSHKSNQTQSISNAPLGVISAANLSWEEIYLHFEFFGGGGAGTVAAGSPKDIKIFFRPGSQTLRPKCKIEVKEGRSVPIPIALQYGRVLNNRTENNVTENFLFNLASSPDTNFIINFASSPSRYNFLLKNLNQEDLVFIFPGCFPGVTL